MKVMQVFNQYRSLFNGEEAVVLRTQSLLRSRGVASPLWMPSSRDIQGLAAKAGAFIGGIYNRRARQEMLDRLRWERPDLVHAHNLYPLLSPSVLGACRSEGVPVVMSLHNQQLTCPVASHLRNGEKCEKCYGGREHHCVLQNCRGNLVESIGYALRSRVARRFGLLQRNVNQFIALTEFAKRRLVGAGFDRRQIAVLPNMVETIHPPVDPSHGMYVAFAGRLSPEKDPLTLLRAAGEAPQCLVRLAGGGPLEEEVLAARPANVEFCGRVPTESMPDFYRGARCLVLCSNAFEMCPLVISEAMSHGLPVVASRIGGIDELVEDEVTGLLFEPGDHRQLSDHLRRLWDDPQLCRRLGQAGHDKAREQFSSDAYFNRLMQIYHQAMGRPAEAPVSRNFAILETEAALP